MSFIKKDLHYKIKKSKHYNLKLNEGERFNIIYNNGLSGGTYIAEKHFKYFNKIIYVCTVDDGYIAYSDNNLVAHIFKDNESIVNMSQETIDPFAVTIMLNGKTDYVYKYGNNLYCVNSVQHTICPQNVKGGVYTAGRLFLWTEDKLIYSAFLDPLNFDTYSGGGEIYLNKPYEKIIGVAKAENGVYVLTDKNVFYLENDGTAFKLNTIDYRFNYIKTGNFGIADGKLMLIHNDNLFIIKKTNIAKADVNIINITPNGVENSIQIGNYCAFKIKGEDTLFVTDGKEHFYVDITGYYIVSNVLIKLDNTAIGDIKLSKNGVGRWVSKKFYSDSPEYKTFLGVNVNALKGATVRVITDKSCRVFTTNDGISELPIYKRAKWIQVEIITDLDGQLIKNVTILYKE